MKTSILELTDSYKVSHHLQYPPNTERVYSYFEARHGSAFPETVFFGLQYLLREYLEGQVVTRQGLDDMRLTCESHFSQPGIMNLSGWTHILEDHGGVLPVSIWAVPEGTVVPVSNVLMTVENTCPRCYWLTNYLETLLVQVWYPTTVATQSREMKKIIRKYQLLTGADENIDFKLHDFGFRGSTSVESAALGGAAHLVNFLGTDTMAALRLVRECYREPMAGFSIPAAEHSTITAWGRQYEADAYGNMLQQFPTGLVAVVSDSYDIYRAVSDIWGSELRDQVLSRDGTLVVRPDSGDPPTVVVEVLERLGAAFGTTPTSTGHRVLPPQVRVIQGDGIDIDSLERILARMEFRGWSVDNIAFGSGGGLLQKVNRDTCRFAFKCSDVVVAGGHREVSKDPATDHSKRSKGGRLKLVHDESGFRTERLEGEDHSDDLLQPVFVNGRLLDYPAFSEIRKRAAL